MTVSRPKVYLILYFLSFVMTSTISPRKEAFEEMPLSEFFMEIRELDNDDEKELKIVEDLMGDDPYIGEGLVEGDEGCKMPGDTTTAAGAVQLWDFHRVIFPPIYVFLFYFKLLSFIGKFV